MRGEDNSWFSERAKTWIVTITMALIFIGMFGGYYAAHNWQAEREATRIEMILKENTVATPPW